MRIFSGRPVFSVIMPSYNHEPFVAEAIHSALSQTIQDIEVIVVDDASTDGTPQEIQKISDKRLQFVGLSKNREIHARNAALKMARGKYIAFLNSDDVWESNKLESQLADFAEKPEPSASFTRVAMITPTSQISTNTYAEGAFISANKTRAEWLRFFFECGNDLCISSAVVPKDVLDKTGLFNESLVQLSDMDMWVRIAAFGDIWINEGVLTKMRIDGKKNLSAPKPPNLRRSEIERLVVFKNYKNIPLADAFFDIIPDPSVNNVIQLAMLARHAWSKSPTHALFADELFGELLSDPQKRQEIVAYFGVEIIHEFIKKRSQLEIITHE